MALEDMKYSIPAIALLGIAFAGQAFAASNGGTITITGAVTDATCTVTGGAGTDGGTSNFTVALSPVEASDLSVAGRTAGHKPYQVIIGGPGQGSCQPGKIATMSFLPSSPPVDGATGHLNNVLADGAQNTQVQMLDGNGELINLADPNNAVNSRDNIGESAPNQTIIDLAAQYVASGAATPGLVSTSVVYAITYN